MTRRGGLLVLAGLLFGTGLLLGLFNKVYVVELGGSTSCGSLFHQKDVFSKDLDNMTNAIGGDFDDQLNVTNFSAHCKEGLSSQKPIVFGLMFLGLVGGMLSFLVPGAPSKSDA